MITDGGGAAKLLPRALGSSRASAVGEHVRGVGWVPAERGHRRTGGSVADCTADSARPCPLVLKSYDASRALPPVQTLNLFSFFIYFLLSLQKCHFRRAQPLRITGLRATLWMRR